MSQDRYVIRGGVDGRERLRILARVLEPTTRALLARAGVRDGMACLDVGCGGGDVTVVLARLAGESGRALGIDMDRVKIELARDEAAQLGLRGLRYAVAEVGADGVAGGFDAVYARCVLTHLPDPAAAVAWMARHARPGGVVVLEDIDFRGHFCEPPSAAFASYVDLYARVVRSHGADPDIGPRLPGLLRDAGCREIEMAVVQPASFTGELKQIAPRTMATIGDAVVAAGLATSEEVAALVRALDELAADERSVVSLPRFVQAFARVP